MSQLTINCQALLKAYETGKLGQTKMPEDSNPSDFASQEMRLAYFTLPMALNYQRDSYKLWEAALKTFDDPEACDVFDIKKAAEMPPEILRQKLLEHKLALQPNKHIQTWQTICRTLDENWGVTGFRIKSGMTQGSGPLGNLLKATDSDFLKLKEIIQKEFKKGFPYLSGPKIFNYWSFIIQEYGGAKLNNSEFIEIAPDTHITKCSVKLGVITVQEASNISREEIAARWRELLKSSGINPIDMHPPLWFWSRNGFKHDL